MSSIFVDPFLTSQIFTFEAVVELFPMPGGWHYVRVPQAFSNQIRDKGDKSFLAVTVSFGTKTWKTSLLPLGDGQDFIALKAEVRKKEQISSGDTVKVVFQLRERL